MSELLSIDTINVLKQLYNAHNGLTFEELKIDKSIFFDLLDENYIEKPEGHIFTTGIGDRIADVKGPLKISSKGKAYIENLKMQEKQIRKNTKRYWITTAVAIIALIKSFQSEFTLIMEQVLKLLGQQ